MMRRLTIGLVALVAIAGAAVADRLNPPQAPRPAADRADAPGGVWACPVVKAAGTGGWIHIVNTGRDASRIRVTFLPDGRGPIEQAVTLPPLRVTTLPTPPAITRFNAGAIVEFAGGNVTVSRTLLLGSFGSTGVAGAACSRPGDASLVVAQGATLSTDTQIALLNPNTADALVDVALLIGGEKIEPESLQHRIVPARGRLVLREGDFAFDEPAVSAEIVARSGRVVADGIFLGRGVFDIAAAQPAVPESVVVASTSRGQVFFASVAVGDEDAVTTGTLLSSTGQTGYAPLINGLPPSAPNVDGNATRDVPPGAVALAVTSRTSPIAIGALWQISRRNVGSETAVSTGVSPSNEAVAVLGYPAAPSTMRLLIANPDPREAVVDVTLMTAAGAARPAALQRFRVPAGRTATISVGGSSKQSTVAVLLRATGGRVVAVLEASAAVSGTFSAFAVTAIPVARVPEVAIEPDPIQGVPVQ